MKFSLPSFTDTNYLVAPTVYPTDRLLRALVLWAIPRSVRPNHVTALRFLLTPPTLFLLVMQWYAWGVPLFLFAALTDAIDGALARTRNMITTWGMMFDPLADKFLIVPALLIVLVAHVPIPLLASIVGIELLIIGMAFIWRGQGRTVQANIWGKIKMILQVAGVLGTLLSVWLSWPLWGLAIALLWASVVFALVGMVRHSI